MKLVEQTEDYWINRAREIATLAHQGQKRRGGEPYITHPEAVAISVENRLKPIAWLHDVPEDTSVTIDDLKKEGFPSYITDAVSLLTHIEGVSNVEYWKEILTNKDAVSVKLADIKHNLASNPSEHAKQKYAKALELFRQAGYSA
jgi:(p)ppGpp synthase/HD superfamily hydrolase